MQRQDMFFHMRSTRLIAPPAKKLGGSEACCTSLTLGYELTDLGRLGCSFYALFPENIRKKRPTILRSGNVASVLPPTAVPRYFLSAVPHVATDALDT